MIASSHSDRRVVVTGLGVISPIGNSVDTFWDALVAGKSGVSKWDCEAAGLPDACAGAAIEFTGHINDFGPLEANIKKGIRKGLKLMNRETQMGVAAAQQAISDSKLSESAFMPERVGVCFGAGFVSMLPEDFLAGVNECSHGAAGFDFDCWGEEGLNQVAPLWLLRCLPNMPACHVAIYNDLRGPNNTITQREAAANLAVAEARNLIADGVADVMVVGGTGTTLLPFNRLHTLMETDVASAESDPAKASRPFDRNRSGSVVGEGAASLILEDLESALRRDAEIYGEIVGAGSSCVIERHRGPRCDRALANAIRVALRNARLAPTGVGHIHAHGLSTQRSDIQEARGIRDVFGSRAESIPLVAAKSHTGNAGAGSGAIELVASLLALKKGTLFPVLNFDEPDPECQLSPVTSADVEAGGTFLNLSMVPQGQASCVVVGAFD